MTDRQTLNAVERACTDLARDGRPDVDIVLTTQELVRLIQEAGLDFNAERRAVLCG